jgi:hypothetical protein
MPDVLYPERVDSLYVKNQELKFCRVIPRLQIKILFFFITPARSTLPMRI